MSTHKRILSLTWFFLLVTMLLAGCVAESTETLTAFPMAVSTVATTTRPTIPVPSARAYQTIAPVDSPTPELPTEILSSATPEVHQNLNCLEVLPTLPANVVSGTLWLTKGDEISGVETITMDLENGKMTPRTGGKYRKFIVSPNRLWIAYQKTRTEAHQLIENQLIIESADGQTQINIPWEEGEGWMWQTIPTWLDNERLLIRIPDVDTDDNISWAKASFLILNPFTGDRQIFRAEYPDMYDTQWMPHWGNWGLTVFDPTLTRVVYLSKEEALQYAYRLWDLQKDQLVTSWSTVSFPLPQWSPDGSRLVVARLDPSSAENNYQLIQVSRDGQIEKLPNIEPYEPGAFEPGEYSWSPDGQLLALWMYPPNSAIPVLGVMDLVSGETTNYCISRYRSSEDGGAIAPLWSLDGTQLIVASQGSTEGTFSTLLVDIKRGFAAKIAENMEPVGWMAAP